MGHSIRLAASLSARSCSTSIVAAPRFENRNYIEDSQALHVHGMIQSHTVGDPASAVMADEREG
jgi:hypothetical protein